MPFDGTLKFDTAIDKTGFKAGLSGLGKIASAGMAVVTGTVAAGTAAVAAMGTAAVKVGTGFESSMSQVIATMGITKDTVADGVNSYELLSQAAQDAGANTTFSASEAADALNYLALAGYSAQQAADALPSVLDLAAAGGLDLAYASDLATDAMASLGIEANGENLTKFGDQMATTASKANTSVGQLGEAILTVGGTAKSLAGGTTELNTALGVLANRGIKGAEGGTHLRNMILSLTAPTDTAKEALDALGVSALDADGNMRPMNETFADLSQAMNGMNDGDKSAILSDIFNKTDLAAAQAMMAGCGEEFQALTAALNDSDGAMAQMAQTMNDTLDGDIKSLQSKAEALGNAVYGELQELLRELAQMGGAYISELTEAFDRGGFEGAAKAVGGILSDAVTKLTGYLPDILRLGVSVVESLITGMTKNLPAIFDAGTEILGILLESVSGMLPKLAGAAVQIIGMLGKSLLDNLPLLIDTASQFIENLTSLFSDPENLTKFLDAGMQIIGMLGKALLDNLPLLIGAAITMVQTIGVYLAEHAPELAEAALSMVASLTQLLVDNLPMLITAATDIITAICDGISEHTADLLIAVEEIADVLLDNFGNPEVLGTLFEAAGRILAALIPAAGEAVGDLTMFAMDLCQKLGEALAEVDWAELGLSILNGLLSGLMGDEIDLKGVFADFGDNWVTGIKGAFGIHSPSRLMRDEVGKYLAQGIGVGFTEEMPDVGQDAVSVFDRLRSEIDPGAVRAVSSPAFASLPYDVTPSIPGQIINNYTNTTAEESGGSTSEAQDFSGDIIIPITIGSEQLDTIVIRAAQIANARSGGVTL